MDGKLVLGLGIVAGIFVGWAGMCWWMQEPSPRKHAKDARTNKAICNDPSEHLGKAIEDMKRRGAYSEW
jgi:hypothetical protein